MTRKFFLFGSGAWLIGGALGILTGGAPLAGEASPSLAPTDRHPETTATLSIKARRFFPDTLQLELGQKIRLVIRNHDAELHAFVPVGVLARTTLTIAGNGAPEFGSQGLRRILLPSNGRAEILFVPKHRGRFVFFCDLPGHRMQGVIVVNDGDGTAGE